MLQSLLSIFRARFNISRCLFAISLQKCMSHFQMTQKPAHVVRSVAATALWGVRLVDDRLQTAAVEVPLRFDANSKFRVHTRLSSDSTSTNKIKNPQSLMSSCMISYSTYSVKVFTRNQTKN